MSVVISILIALLVLGILVAVHEGGHFLAGKLLGFKILEFSIGMGPRILKKEKNGTIYSLRAFPIGGLCAFEGEDEEVQSEQSYNSFPAWKRFIVAFAGPFMNMVLAFVLAIIMMAIFGQNKELPMNHPTVVEFSSETAPAKLSGLELGDIVTKVNKKSVKNADEMIAAIREDKDGNIDLTILRPTQDSYYSINGIKISDDTDLDKFIKKHPSKEYTATVENTTELNITIENSYDKNTGYNVIGASISSTWGIYTEKYNVLTAFPAGAKYCVSTTKLMYKSLFDMVTGKVSAKDVSGIVGVVDVVNDNVSTVVDSNEISTGEKVKDLVIFAFYLAVLLSLNLGIINLLPLPALDGGRIVFNIIEMAVGRPVNPKVEGYIHAVGLVLLLILIAVITVKDIVFLFI